MLLDADDNQAKEPTVEEFNAVQPRKVRLYSGDAKLLFWVVVIFIGMGVIWFVVYYQYASRQIREREALRSGGREMLADVTAFNQDRGGAYVHYIFQVDGRDYHASAQLPRHRINASVGGEIPVRYLPSDPSVSHPSEWEWSAEWDIFFDLCMIYFPGLGVVAGIKLYKLRELARKGWVVEGKVTGCVPKGSKFSVDYEFRTDTDALIEGSNDYSSEEYEYGSSIRVIYLRKNPARNDCYPLDSYRMVSS